jgi:hypothetical protein
MSPYIQLATDGARVLNLTSSSWLAHGFDVTVLYIKVICILTLRPSFLSSFLTPTRLYSITFFLSLYNSCLELFPQGRTLRRYLYLSHLVFQKGLLFCLHDLGDYCSIQSYRATYCAEEHIQKYKIHNSFQCLNNFLNQDYSTKKEIFF